MLMKLTPGFHLHKAEYIQSNSTTQTNSRWLKIKNKNKIQQVHLL
jgi:hypothetical protein